MPTPKKTTARRTTSRRTTSRRTTARRASAKEPAALKRLNKSLDGAESALVALRKDVQSGAGDAYKNLQQLVRNARRDSGKLGKAIQKDLDQLQKAIVRGQRTAGRSGGRSTARRTTARRSTGTRTAAKRTTTRRSTARRSASRGSSSSR